MTVVCLFLPITIPTNLSHIRAYIHIYDVGICIFQCQLVVGMLLLKDSLCVCTVQCVYMCFSSKTEVWLLLNVCLCEVVLKWMQKDQHMGWKYMQINVRGSTIVAYAYLVFSYLYSNYLDILRASEIVKCYVMILNFNLLSIIFSLKHAFNSPYYA